MYAGQVLNIADNNVCRSGVNKVMKVVACIKAICAAINLVVNVNSNLICLILHIFTYSPSLFFYIIYCILYSHFSFSLLPFKEKNK